LAFGAIREWHDRVWQKTAMHLCVERLRWALDVVRLKDELAVARAFAYSEL